MAITTKGRRLNTTRKDYTGNCPRNVSRDAKYSVIGEPPVVRLIYRTGRGEEALLVTRTHAKLIELIRQIRGPRPQGVFYINEHKQVLIPFDGAYVCAGTYDGVLEFEYEPGVIIGPKPPSGTRPGDLWVGPHVGIPYVLSAKGDDLYYWHQWRNETGVLHRRKILLSAGIGLAAATDLARRLVSVKGPLGGRIYVNEARYLFAPVDEKDRTWTYRYLGPLANAPWYVPVEC